MSNSSHELPYLPCNWYIIISFESREIVMCEKQNLMKNVNI